MVDGRSEGRGDAGVAGDERPFPRLAGRPPLSIPFSAVLSFLKNVTLGSLLSQVYCLTLT